MKTVLCFGDSNLWGNKPGSFNPTTGLSGRFARYQRWTGLLQQELKEYYIIEEGINGRTTIFDEIFPGRPYKNGLALLPACLDSHYPIDLILLWLGTNDTKIQFKQSATMIAENLRQLVKVIKSSDKGSQGLPPNLLIIAPQPIINILNLHPQLDEFSIEKSKCFGKLYQQIANEGACAFLDAGKFVTSSPIDGVHLDEEQSKIIAEAIATKIKELLK